MVEEMKNCLVCGKSFLENKLFPVLLLRQDVQDLLTAQGFSIEEDADICRADMGVLRRRVLEESLPNTNKTAQRVLTSIQERSVLSEDTETIIQDQSTFGQRLADRVVTWGGSWSFLISFAAIMAAWILLNVWALKTDAFDPFPFILLNLVLSCLAAVQAPLIMMSQNRQEAKDRLRSENDYAVNLKSELEIRHLQAKLNHFMHMTYDQLQDIQKALPRKN